MSQIVFRETQRVPERWRALGVIGGFGLVGVVIAASVADPPSTAGAWISLAIGGLACLGVAFLAAAARLDVAVSRQGVDVRWFPLSRATIAHDRIAAAEAVTYRPFRRFGGWGIRWGAHGARAYSMSGDRAVRLTLADGHDVYLGSLEPEALAAAIWRAGADR